MLGFLLARAGVDVVVLEKHADFLRDFRGDTIHPSTMQIMHELGMLDEFLKLPHQRVSDLTAQFGDERLRVADFSSLPVPAPFMMPQWDFLNFLVERAKDLPGFRLLMRTQATGLLRHDNKVTGVAAVVRDETARWLEERELKQRLASYEAKSAAVSQTSPPGGAKT